MICPHCKAWVEWDQIGNKVGGIFIYMAECKSCKFFAMGDQPDDESISYYEMMITVDNKKYRFASSNEAHDFGTSISISYQYKDLTDGQGKPVSLNTDIPFHKWPEFIPIQDNFEFYQQLIQRYLKLKAFI